MNHDKISSPPPYILNTWNHSDLNFYFIFYFSLCLETHLVEVLREVNMSKGSSMKGNKRSKRPIKLIISKQPRFFQMWKTVLFSSIYQLTCFIGGFMLGCRACHNEWGKLRPRPEHPVHIQQVILLDIFPMIFEIIPFLFLCFLSFLLYSRLRLRAFSLFELKNLSFLSPVYSTLPLP